MPYYADVDYFAESFQLLATDTVSIVVIVGYVVAVVVLYTLGNRGGVDAGIQQPEQLSKKDSERIASRRREMHEGD